jgi:hypothetical protein
MVPVAVAGNILGEATAPSGNIFNEAMRGVRAGDELVSPIVLAIRRHVPGGGQVHANDTPLPVLDPEPHNT